MRGAKRAAGLLAQVRQARAGLEEVAGLGGERQGAGATRLG